MQGFLDWGNGDGGPRLGFVRKHAMELLGITALRKGFLGRNRVDLGRPEVLERGSSSSVANGGTCIREGGSDSSME